MRVTNKMIYDNSLYNMQSSLNAMMESNIQGGTQKQINRPSDDPAGAALVLNTRVDIAATEQYERNVDTARGWLELADTTLQSVSTTIASIKTLAEQAATETMSPENRQQISYQIEQLFGQLMNLSNTEFEGKSLFAGHKYDETAFDEVLGVTSKDENFDTSTVTVTGQSEESMAVRFVHPTDPPPVASETVGGGNDIHYEWSMDGGQNWTTATLPAGETSITMEGVTLDIRPGTEVTYAVRGEEDNVFTDDGSFLYVHRTTEYMGDDNDRNIYGVTTNAPDGFASTVVGSLKDNAIFELDAATDLSVPGSAISYSITQSDGTVQNYTATVPDPATGKVDLPFDDSAGNRMTIQLDTTTASTNALNAGLRIDLQPRRVDLLGGDPTQTMINAQGVFPQNTLVRMEPNSDGTTNIDFNAAGSTINYSYSTDNGHTWVTASSIVPTPATGDIRLTLPGGFVELSETTAGTGSMDAGTQMIIHPDRADLGYEIMEDAYVPANYVGKDIFGGQYNGEVVEGPNLFEVVGKLIAFCEYNDTEGISQTLEDITAAHENVETQNTYIGGITNRLDIAENMLSAEKVDQQERLSYTEDIDLTELLNNLAKQELTYNTVLKSSSMIMQLNLSQFI